MDQQLRSIVACRDCPGYCCKLMFLPCSKEQMERYAEEDAEKLKVLALEVSKDPTPELVHKLGEDATVLEMLQFGVKHLHIVEDVVDDEGTSVGETGFCPVRYAYTCDQFDLKTGRCSAYRQRPWTCKSFICSAAASGRTPTLKDFPYSTQITDEQAAEIRRVRENENCIDVRKADAGDTVEHIQGSGEEV